MRKIIESFDERHRALWGHHTVRLRHCLGEDPRFSDTGLVDLLDQVPRERMAINTMARTGHDLASWQACDPADLGAEQLLDAVRAGRIWINVMGINRSLPAFAELLAAIYAEFRVLVPGFEPFRQDMGLLISSPNAQVFYHCDVPGQSLWQLRGRKRIWLYPNSEPFMRPAELEAVVRRVIEEEITYAPWFDDHAQVIDLEPGDMLHWPLNAPHRVMNHDCLNVSLTTEHWTREILRSYLMNFGNGLLRRQLGWRPRSRATSGPAFWAKAGMATFWRVSGLQQRQRFRRDARLAVDPQAADGVREKVSTPAG